MKYTNTQHIDWPVFEDGCEPGQEVLDGGRHLGHADNINDPLEGPQYAAQHLRVFLS